LCRFAEVPVKLMPPVSTLTVGLYKFANPVYHSLMKAHGFNPCAYE
jgi:hypothetical protein